MRAKSGLWVAALAFLSFLALLMPHAAHAQNAPTATTLCPSGNQEDATYNNNLNNFQRELLAVGHNINAMFPVAPAMNACQQAIMSALSGLPGLGNPIATVVSAVTSVLTGLIGTTCGQVMGAITQTQNSIINALSVCLPLGSLNLNLGLSGLNANACSGNQIPVVTGFSQSSPLMQYSPFNYLR